MDGELTSLSLRPCLYRAPYSFFNYVKTKFSMSSTGCLLYFPDAEGEPPCTGTVNSSPVNMPSNGPVYLINFIITYVEHINH